MAEERHCHGLVSTPGAILRRSCSGHLDDIVGTHGLRRRSGRDRETRGQRTVIAITISPSDQRYEYESRVCSCLVLVPSSFGDFQDVIPHWNDQLATDFQLGEQFSG